MKYTIGSGYYDSHRELPGFPSVWLSCLSKANPKPSSVIVLGVGGANNPYGDRVQFVSLDGNLGYIGSLLSGLKQNSFCGWSAGMLALAMIAYNNETDFIYVEQDCLVFGDWVNALYDALGSKLGVVFGSNNLMECAQSLFLVRHSFIPQFVADYICQGPERCESNIPEAKFARLERLKPSDWGRFAFGYDRTRPFNKNDSAFYIQQVTQDDINNLAGII